MYDLFDNIITPLSLNRCIRSQSVLEGVILVEFGGEEITSHK